MKVIEGARGGLIKAWTDGVDIEDSARKQLDNIAAMPFIYKHVAIMPDSGEHPMWGKARK